ncbi:MAG: ribosome biogenesis GTPase [Bacteroidia bacterium]|jgi:ribosome biogenesis GTPase
MLGRVAKSTGSWYEIWLEDGRKLDARLRGKMRLQGKELTNPVAVGDWVELEIDSEDLGIISKVCQRTNYIIRKATKLKSRFHIVASNIDQAFILVSLKSPRTSTGFIDRFLVACESFDIKAGIVFNKIDLLEEHELEELDYLIDAYESIGYQTFKTSLVTGVLDPNLQATLTNMTTLFFGHSGVGKSSLLNIILPESNQKVNAVSEAHQKGKHTTTFAQMFKGKGLEIIDIPGIKEFGLDQIEPWKISHYFPEMRRVLSTCKYNTCLHESEPKCGVINAVENGVIKLFRYENYLRILNSEEFNF